MRRLLSLVVLVLALLPLPAAANSSGLALETGLYRPQGGVAVTRSTKVGNLLGKSNPCQ
jgi:hypothetical protein